MNKVLIPLMVPLGSTFKCVIMTPKRDPVTKRSSSGREVFIAGPGSYHKEVVKTARSNNPELENYIVRGGGRITIGNTTASTNPNTIRVYGYSVDFGQMNKDTVETLLSEYCKENDLELINETGDGY